MRPGGIMETWRVAFLAMSFSSMATWSFGAKGLVMTKTLPFSSTMMRPSRVLPFFRTSSWLSYWSEMTLLGSTMFSMRSRRV